MTRCGFMSRRSQASRCDASRRSAEMSSHLVSRLDDHYRSFRNVCTFQCEARTYTEAESNPVEQHVSDNDDFGPQYISPRYTIEKISPGALADWIDVWEDRIQGWWLDHALALRGQRNGGFVIVHIATGIIEALEVAYQGKDSDGNSAQVFRDGFLRLFSAPKTVRVAPQDVAHVLYKSVRCGLSHTAMLYGPVFLVDDDRVAPLQLHVTPDGRTMDSVFINPTKFLGVVTLQFQRYVKMLRSGQGAGADKRRMNFERAWHSLHARKLPPSLGAA